MLLPTLDYQGTHPFLYRLTTLEMKFINMKLSYTFLHTDCLSVMTMSMNGLFCFYWQ
jgi:hypothetical protein